MKCRLIREMEGLHGNKLPVGLEIEHVQAPLLVQMGCAEPADEECRAKANMSAAQMAAARYAYERVDRGIDPEDYDAYDKGYMVGYNPDGSWKPGPNYGEHEEAQRRQRRRESPIIITDED